MRSQRRSDNRCSVHRTNSIQCAEIVMRMVVEKTNMGASSVEREGFSAQRLIQLHNIAQERQAVTR